MSQFQNKVKTKFKTTNSSEFSPEKLNRVRLSVSIRELFLMRFEINIELNPKNKMCSLKRVI